MKMISTKAIFLSIIFLTACATKIEIIDEAVIRSMTIKTDAILFERHFIAKGTKLRVRYFQNGIRAVSFATTNQEAGGILVLGGLPAFLPMNVATEHLFEIDSSNCLSGKTVGFDTFLRSWTISNDVIITSKFLTPTNICFDDPR